MSSVMDFGCCRYPLFQTSTHTRNYLASGRSVFKQRLVVWHESQGPAAQWACVPVACEPQPGKAAKFFSYGATVVMFDIKVKKSSLELYLTLLPFSFYRDQGGNYNTEGGRW